MRKVNGMGRSREGALIPSHDITSADPGNSRLYTVIMFKFRHDMCRFTMRGPMACI